MTEVMTIDWRIKLILGLAGVLLLGRSLHAQAEAKAELSWQADSIRIGEPVRVRLEVRAPARAQVLLPDADLHFKPFRAKATGSPQVEHEDGRQRLTQQYRVTSFELDSVQRLRLPYSLVIGEDTLAYQTPEARIPFRSVLPADTTGLSYRKDLRLAAIHPPIDWVFWGLLGGIALGLATIGAILLRGPYKRWQAVRRIRRQWQALDERLAKLEANAADPLAFVNELNAIWKAELSRGHGANYLPALSARELARRLRSPSFETLAEHDRRSLVHLANYEETLNYTDAEVSLEDLRGYAHRVADILAQTYAQREASPFGEPASAESAAA